MGHKGCGLTAFPSCSVSSLLYHLFLFGLCRTEGVKRGQVKLMKDFFFLAHYFILALSGWGRWPNEGSFPIGEYFRVSPCTLTFLGVVI